RSARSEAQYGPAMYSEMSRTVMPLMSEFTAALVLSGVRRVSSFPAPSTKAARAGYGGGGEARAPACSRVKRRSPCARRSGGSLGRGGGARLGRGGAGGGRGG